MYHWLELKTAADLAQLANFISSEYAPDVVAKKLANGISDAVKGVLVEKFYVDKDYRSTYYNFYSKKGLRYRPDCVRLHFFDSTVCFDDKMFRLKSKVDERLQDHYFGYMVLRPTLVGTIGRTVLSPDIRKGVKGLYISAEHKVHLLGEKLFIWGFPWMEQHIDISVCAHVACWSILRHYSERYNIHREYLTHDITMMAQQFDPGGLVPSRGLGILHAERIFQEAGTFPFYVSRKLRLDPATNQLISDVSDVAFERQIGAYLESGFPLFAAMKKQKHAVAVVGWNWRTPVAPTAAGLRYVWDEVESVIVADDNHLPYLSIPKSGDPDYSVADIDTFIVGLPEKVYYPADAVDALAPNMYQFHSAVPMPPPDQTIIRYFMATASGLRGFMRENESEFDPALLQVVMTLPLTQFVWVIEYATEAQWAQGKIEARAVVDATANLMEVYPQWLLHNRERALIFPRHEGGDIGTGIGALKLANMGHTGYSRMVKNPRRIQSK